MFDFANSSYTTIVITVAFSVYFAPLVASEGTGDLLWSQGLLISNLLVILLSPLAGAIADGSGRKKAFLFGTYLACVAGTAGLYFAVPGAIALALALFVVSNVAFALGESLVAAFLPEISTPKNVGRISGFGWGLGYMGGLACLMLIRPLLADGFTLDNLANIRKIWPVTALFFLVAGIPTFVFLRERAARTAGFSLLSATAEGFHRLRSTARSLRHFHQLARYLVIYFVYGCGLMTVISFAGIFAAKTLHFTANELIVLFLVLQVSSALGAGLAGLLQDRIGSRTTIQAVLLLWVAVCVAAWATPSKEFFWGVALVSGLGIGGLQAASRGFVSILSPVAKSGEFFGFWGLSLRAAFALGPLVFGTTSALAGSQRTAILVTAVFFVAGFVGLFFVDQEEGRRAAKAWDESDEGRAAVA